MRDDIDHIHTPEALAAFFKKVEKLKAEGLPVTVIARRLGVPRTTLNARLRVYRSRIGV